MLRVGYVAVPSQRVRMLLDLDLMVIMGLPLSLCVYQYNECSAESRVHLHNMVGQSR